MEFPHAEQNSRNSVRRVTCSKLKCYTTLIRIRGEPSEAKSGKPINVVHIFRRIRSHDRNRKRDLYLPMDEKKLVKVQGCSHKRYARREFKRL